MEGCRNLGLIDSGGFVGWEVETIADAERAADSDKVDSGTEVDSDDLADSY